jgi:cutinase
MRAVKKLIPAATGYAVKYPASFSDDSPKIGIADVISHIEAQATACPTQKFVLVGYSQGAAIDHFVAAQLPPELLTKVIASTTFGDPGMPGPDAITRSDNAPSAVKKIGGIPQYPPTLASNAKYNCHKGDPVCGPGTDVLNHLLYSSGSWIKDSAAFISAKYKASGRI